MQVKVENLQGQVRFWTLLGPLVALMALFIITVKASFIYFYLPLVAMVGLPLCWQWRLRGLAIAFGVLSAAVAYHYFETPVEELFWLVGMGVAIALSFTITALSIEEMSSIVKRIQVESKNRLEHFLQVDEKLKVIHEEFAAERNALAAQLHSCQQLLEIAREEFLDANKERERLKLELIRKKHELAKAQEDVHDAEQAIQMMSTEHHKSA